MKVSGWCSAPEGARPMCGGCRVLDCEHECHGRPVVDRDSRTTSVAFGGAKWENESARSQRELTPGHDHYPAKDK